MTRNQHRSSVNYGRVLTDLFVHSLSRQIRIINDEN